MMPNVLGHYILPTLERIERNMFLLGFCFTSDSKRSLLTLYNYTEIVYSSVNFNKRKKKTFDVFIAMFHDVLINVHDYNKEHRTGSLCQSNDIKTTWMEWSVIKAE